MVTEKRNPHGRNLRKGRFSNPGMVYVITIVTRNRKAVFSDFSSARSLIQVLRGHEQRGFAQTLCFVVMPDHLHWMMQLQESKTLAQAIQALKSVTSRKLGRTLFQRGYHDHAVRKDEDLKAMARYIVANPLRAGLVTHINDYSHWDAIWL